MRAPELALEIGGDVEVQPVQRGGSLVEPEGEVDIAVRPCLAARMTAEQIGGDEASEPLEKLDGPFDWGRGGPGGWIVLVGPELHLGPKPDKVVPDLAAWRRETFPREVLDADADTEPAAITTAPDWICEILSEGTEATDRGKKMRIYRRENVRHVWLLDPRSRTLEVYRLNARSHWEELETYEGDAAVRAEPFDAVALDLSTLWGW